MKRGGRRKIRNYILADTDVTRGGTDRGSKRHGVAVDAVGIVFEVLCYVLLCS